jgi:hypothetical protein
MPSLKGYIWIEKVKVHHLAVIKLNGSTGQIVIFNIELVLESNCIYLFVL